MLLRRPHDLAALVREGRARAGWSQSRLAESVGVSRQWISLVENGKTSVEFHLVMAALQALGYRIHVGSSDTEMGGPRGAVDFPGAQVHEPSQRTPLTRGGEPLGSQRTRRPRGGLDA
jgi:y4mF family transcriptional regulator